MITIDEAIEIIKNVEAENTVSFIRKGSLDNVINLLRHEEETEGYRTPAKVKMIHNADNAIEPFEWVCPRCSTPHDEISMPPYCFKCGQALDWDDEGFDKYMADKGYPKRGEE